MDLKEIDIIGDDINNHWYYCSKAQAMLQLVQNTSPIRILDIGAGSAFFTKILLAKTTAKEAWCVDTSYSSNSISDVVGKPIYFKREIGSSNANLVILMDVLEHIDDDINFLKNYVDKVDKGSYFFISVPAFQFLWSNHDVFLDHKRRYTINKLDKVVSEAGLKIIHSNYYFALVFPLAFLTRLISNILGKFRKNNKSQLTTHSSFINWLLKNITSLELPFIKYNRLAGLTIFCLAKKN